MNTVRNDIKQRIENNVVKQNEQAPEILTNHKELTETTSEVTTNVKTF